MSMATECKHSATIVEQQCHSTEFEGPSASTNVHAAVYPSVHDDRVPQSVFSIIEPPAPHSSITTHILDPAPTDIFPDGGLRSWSVIMGSFFLLMSTYGLMNSTGVLQSYFATHQLADYSTSAVGWIPGVFLFFGLGLSAQVGSMFDRYGPTGILITGAGCYVAGLLLLAECRLYWHFILTLGVLTGTGSALLSTVALAAVPHWFDRKVGMAMGAAMAGGGSWGCGVSADIKGGIHAFGLQVGDSTFGVDYCHFLWPGDLVGQVSFAERSESVDYQFASLSRCSIHLVDVGDFQFSTVGRLMAGGIADKYGRINTQAVLIALGVLAIFVIWLPFGNTLPGLYMFSTVFGLASGSFLSLAPACIGQISKASEVGGRFGICYSIVSIATLICIPIGGEMLQKVGKRAMVGYLGSVLIVALGMFTMARWACLGCRWRWHAKI
ncbi:MFS general substrate transporter [Penicillium verhagenii]|nr:MFS general substrate transporter [Penicillium verhagenii]